MAMWLIGYYFRGAGRPPGTLAVALVFLIASVMRLIMDLDQPQRGTIRASQEVSTILTRIWYKGNEKRAYYGWFQHYQEIEA